MSDTEVWVGDTLPPIDVILADEETGPLDLTAAGTSVLVHLYDPTGAEWGTATAGVTDPAIPGRVYRPWDPGETDDPLLLTATFQVTSNDGNRTFPSPGLAYTVLVKTRTPIEADLLDPEVLADEYGLAPLTAASRIRLTAAIRSAGRIVRDYLIRPLTIQTVTEDLPYYIAVGDNNVTVPPVLAITSQTYDPAKGLVTAVYTGGIDALSIGTIRTFIERTSVADYFSRLPLAQRPVSSMTVEGQSKTFMSPMLYSGYSARRTAVQGDTDATIKLTDLLPWRNPGLEESLGVFSRPRPHDFDARLDNIPGVDLRQFPDSWGPLQDPLAGRDPLP